MAHATARPEEVAPHRVPLVAAVFTHQSIVKRVGQQLHASRVKDRHWRPGQPVQHPLNARRDVSRHRPLVNNAGVEERGDNNVVIGPADVTVDVIRKTFESNVFGTVRVLHAFLPLLQRSGNPVVVNVSTGLGSLTQVAAAPVSIYPGVAYPASRRLST